VGSLLAGNGLSRKDIFWLLLQQKLTFVGNVVKGKVIPLQARFGPEGG